MLLTGASIAGRHPGDLGERSHHDAPRVSARRSSSRASSRSRSAPRRRSPPTRAGRPRHARRGAVDRDRGGVGRRGPRGGRGPGDRHRGRRGGRRVHREGRRRPQSRRTSPRRATCARRDRGGRLHLHGAARAPPEARERRRQPGSPRPTSDRPQLTEALGHFGVEARIVGTVAGPHVTRYELKLAPGIKMSKVANLKDDIAYALAASESASSRRSRARRPSGSRCRTRCAGSSTSATSSRTRPPAGRRSRCGSARTSPARRSAPTWRSSRTCSSRARPARASPAA